MDPVFDVIPGLEGGELEGGAVPKQFRSRQKLLKRAKRACVKRAGSNARILSNIRRAKKSASARRSRCSAKGLPFRAGAAEPVIVDLTAGEFEPVVDLSAGSIEAGGVALQKMPIKKLRSRAKKMCVKANGKKGIIARSIRRASRSKKAMSRRCASRK